MKSPSLALFCLIICLLTGCEAEKPISFQEFTYQFHSSRFGSMSVSPEMMGPAATHCIPIELVHAYLDPTFEPGEWELCHRYAGKFHFDDGGLLLATTTATTKAWEGPGVPGNYGCPNTLYFYLIGPDNSVHDQIEFDGYTYLCDPCCESLEVQRAYLLTSLYIDSLELSEPTGRWRMDRSSLPYAFVDVSDEPAWEPDTTAPPPVVKEAPPAASVIETLNTAFPEIELPTTFPQDLWSEGATATLSEDANAALHITAPQTIPLARYTLEGLHVFVYQLEIGKEGKPLHFTVLGEDYSYVDDTEILDLQTEFKQSSVFFGNCIEKHWQEAGPRNTGLVLEAVNVLKIQPDGKVEEIPNSTCN